MATGKIKFLLIVGLLSTLAGCGGGDVTTGFSKQSAPSNPPSIRNTGSATLNWVAPTEYTDGTSISSLGGHKIYVNNGSGYTLLTTLTNPSISTYVVENLAPGSYTFAVVSFDSDGIESSFSNEAYVTI